jgi:predicted unusual protein kinase regulating ubiquinone biosynthesis (AarF/ABC1/UbiB family)
VDDHNFFNALKRYWQVGTQVGGLATRLAGQQYFGATLDDDAYAQTMRQALGQLRGPVMKVAQFLATIPDALPKAYSDELLTLQSQAPPMGIPFVRRRMVAELGPQWENCFHSFNLQACAAASLGQVHQAIHPDGTPLACKLQYPAMQTHIQADLNQLKVLLGMYHTWNKAVDTTFVQEEIATRLHEELDYVHEANQMAIYAKIFKDTDFVTVPVSYPNLSTQRLLTMTWMDGGSVLGYADAPSEYRHRLAERLFYAWYMPFYHHGVLHGDPHPGNYLATDAGTLQLLDFGCIRHFSKEFICAVIWLYEALMKNDREKAVHAYETWGFKNLSCEMIDVITQWARLLYDPLLDDRIRPIQENFSGAKGWETATKVHAELHKLGGIRPPREFVFMDRAAVGIGAVMMRLKVECNWHHMFEELIAPVR